MSFKQQKYFYGDIPEDNAGGNTPVNKANEKNTWPLWEIFCWKKQRARQKQC